jgi:hypothetical protein
VTVEPEFDEMMNDTVTVASRTVTDSYGRHTWGTPVSLNGRVSFQTRLIRNSEGREVVSSGRVYLHEAIAASPDAKLVLPSGATPVVSAIDTFTDELGNHHTTIHFE